MGRLLKTWIIQIKKEFGIFLEIIRVDPSGLLEDKTELDYDTKIDALAEWSLHNNQKTVPVISFDGGKITCLEDLQRVLQEG